MFVRGVGEALGCGARGQVVWSWGVGNVFFLDRRVLFLLRCVSVRVRVCVLFLLSVLVCCGVIDYSAINL